MSFDYNEYRKRIEGVFTSDLGKFETKLMKKILFIISKQSDLDQTITHASIFCDKTQTHIKFINAAHFFSSKLKGDKKFYSLQELLDAVEKSVITNGEVAIIREGRAIDPYTGIKDIVASSQISLIIVQMPFSDTIENEKTTETNLGDTIEKLVYDALTTSKIPLLILKNTTLMEEGYNHVVMAGSDWINDYAFNTLIQLSNKLKAKVTLLPFIKESIYKESEIPHKINEVKKELEKFIKDANDWLIKQKYQISIEKGLISKNRFEFLENVHLLKPDLVALYVPRKPEVVESFLEIVRKVETSVIIVPDLK